jgi:hypothetical protein
MEDKRKLERSSWRRLHNEDLRVVGIISNLHLAIPHNGGT